MARMRTLAALALMSLATAAHADWERVGEASGAAFYVDPASIVRSAELYRVSVVQDLGEPEAGARSRLVVYDVDCGSLAIRSLSGIEYAEPMAKGGRVSAWERESDWLYVTPRTGSLIAPRSPYATVVRRVCARDQSSHSIGRSDSSFTFARIAAVVSGSMSWSTSPPGVRSIHASFPSGRSVTS
jgi:hypothetical protein